MMNTIKYIFDLAMQGFWPFIGCMLILGIFARVIVAIALGFFNHLNVLARGWPTQPTISKKREDNEEDA